ncbi:hypothetical protein TNCV_4542121 [Trichonephila clavipes]|nr:hypothetical protein TNCV_4542121 [Trichonephila clavipes]
MLRRLFLTVGTAWERGSKSLSTQLRNSFPKLGKCLQFSHVCRAPLLAIKGRDRLHHNSIIAQTHSATDCNGTRKRYHNGFRLLRFIRCSLVPFDAACSTVECTEGIHCFANPRLETTGVCATNGEMNGDGQQKGTTLCLLTNPVSANNITMVGFEFGDTVAAKLLRYATGPAPAIMVCGVLDFTAATL